MLYSNRSAVHLARGDAAHALADASVGGVEPAPHPPTHTQYPTVQSIDFLLPSSHPNNAPVRDLLSYIHTPALRSLLPGSVGLPHPAKPHSTVCAQAAVQNKPGWSKAFSRRAAAQTALKDFVGAAESLLRAYELEGKDDYCTQLVDALMCVFRGVNLVQPGTPSPPTRGLGDDRSASRGQQARRESGLGYLSLVQRTIFLSRRAKTLLARFATFTSLYGGRREEASAGQELGGGGLGSADRPGRLPTAAYGGGQGSAQVGAGAASLSLPRQAI